MDSTVADTVRTDPADRTEAARTAPAPATPAPPPPADRPGGEIAGIVEPLLIAIGMVLIAVTPKPPMMGDGLARYQALIQLLEQRQLPEMPYSLIGPLFAAPLWAVGTWIDNPQILVLQYNLLLFALGLVAVHFLLRDRIDPRLLRRFLLLLITASMIAAHVMDFYGEVFTAVTVGVGLLAATRAGTGRGTRVAGWVMVVLGVANTPATIVALGLVVVVLCLRERRIRYLSVPVAAALVIMAESWLRFGDPMHSQYANHGGGETIMPYSGEPGFSYPFLVGLLAIVFSFGKGLLWFTPGLFLPLRRRLRAAGGPAGGDVWSIWLLWAAFTAGLVLVYAPWWGWYGGLYWGPRFFLFAILPACLGLAVYLGDERAGPWTNLAAVAAVSLSVWGGMNSLVYGRIFPWTCYENGYRLEALCHFTPEFSPLWYPFVDPPVLTWLPRAAVVCYALVLVWLVAPPLVRLARQVGAAVRRHAPGRRDWRW